MYQYTLTNIKQTKCLQTVMGQASVSILTKNSQHEMTGNYKMTVRYYVYLLLSFVAVVFETIYYGYVSVLMSFRRQLCKKSGRIWGRIDLNTFTQTIKKNFHIYWIKCTLALHNNLLFSELKVQFSPFLLRCVLFYERRAVEESFSFSNTLCMCALL